MAAMKTDFTTGMNWGSKQGKSSKQSDPGYCLIHRISTHRKDNDFPLGGMALLDKIGMNYQEESGIGFSWDYAFRKGKII